MKYKIRWPRGRYNGRRITGLKVTFIWRCDMIDWIPVFKSNYGEPYVMWLGFQIRTEVTYHYMDK